MRVRRRQAYERNKPVSSGPLTFPPLYGWAAGCVLPSPERHSLSGPGKVDEFLPSSLTGPRLLSFSLSSQVQRQADHFLLDDEKIIVPSKNDWYPNIAALRQFSLS